MASDGDSALSGHSSIDSWQGRSRFHLAVLDPNEYLVLNLSDVEEMIKHQTTVPYVAAHSRTRFHAATISTSRSSTSFESTFATFATSSS